MKNFIKSLKFRLSDLFLLIGFLPFAIFLIFGQLFMQFQNPSDVAFPLWAAILCFAVMVGSWSVYLYLEVYRSKDKYNLYIASAFLVCILNLHHDGATGNWLSEGINVKGKYIYIYGTKLPQNLSLMMNI